MKPLPVGTVTFLFTDIEGSAKLWEQQTEAMQIALARHDALVRGAIEAEGGVIFKTLGDAFYAAFPTAPEAFAAAASAQLALIAEPRRAETPLRVRMALHTGAVQMRDNDYFGPVLTRVARLLAAGWGDQTLVSAATYELVRDRLPDGVELRDLGSHRLKDLERPEQVFQLTHLALPHTFPALRTLDATPNNLPQQVTSFIGREKAIADVTGLLTKTRLLTLLGAGGAGKTRLSLQVAADLLDEQEDGTWFVELAPLSDASLLAQTVAQVLGVKEQSERTTTETLAEHLKEKRLLLLLDNCEHLIGACAPFVSALLRACPGVRVLATSREPLSIRGEQTYRVPSLSLPTTAEARKATADGVTQYEATRLFIERALLVKPDFAVTNANAPALAQLCFRLDGIPLAIELAAARARSLSVEQINDKLDARFQLLTGGDRSALPRQQTLRALVDWSYDLLTDAERTMWARLSVFAGGWTLAAAEAVCAFPPIEAWEVLDYLTSLADKSLVQAEDDAVLGETRYRMLETLRQYGVEKRNAGGEETVQAKGRHAAYFADLAHEADAHLNGPEQGTWLNRLETEHDNMRAALDWCAARIADLNARDAETSSADEDKEALQVAALRIVGRLRRFWMKRGYISEGREQAARALMGRGGSDAYKAARGVALVGAGNLANIQRDHDAAQQALEESLVLFRAVDHKTGAALALNTMGVIAFSVGDVATARDLIEEALAAYREMGASANIAIALNYLGIIARRQGDSVQERAFYEEGLSISRALGDKGNISAALANASRVARDQGEYAAARAMLEEAAVLDRELDNKHGVAGWLEDFAALLACTSALHAAAVAWGAASALRERNGAPVPSSEQDEYNRDVEKARSALGETAFSAAWEEGRALGMEEAVERTLAAEFGDKA